MNKFSSLNTAKTTSWLAPVESKEKALLIIKHLREIYIVIGAIQIILSWSLADKLTFESRIAMAIYGGILVTFGFLLGKFKKPLIAYALLSLSFIGVITTSLILFGVIPSGTQNRALPIIGIALVIASVKAVKATLKLNENKN